MKYNIHLYRVGRIELQGIEAGSPEEAIEKAEAIFYDSLIPDKPVLLDSEDPVSALVDIVGDEDYKNSVIYDLDEKGAYCFDVSDFSW